MTRLVEDLLDVARISHGKIRVRSDPVVILDAVKQGAEIARPSIDEKHHSFVITEPGTPLYVVGDAVRLAQVFGNLLRNAARYTAPDGRIGASIAAEGDEVVVRITDNGEGIPSDRLPHVFEAFVQAHTHLGGGGLGIGLTLVKRIVELHDGTVLAESAGPGAGSTFILRFPRAMPGPQQTAGTAEPPASHGLRVVVIDDNADIVETLASLLRLEKHDVSTATSGPDGLRAVRALKPNVVICDLGMPGMDGYEVARRMRADPELRNCILVALSGYAREEDRGRSQKAGFDHHLAKPPTAEDLSAVLRTAAARQS